MNFVRTFLYLFLTKQDLSAIILQSLKTSFEIEIYYYEHYVVGHLHLKNIYIY